MSTKYIASNWRLPNQAGVDSYLNDNYGLTFDGSSEYITAGAIDITGDKSISMWFKTPSASTTQGVFEIQPDPNTSDYLIVWIYNSKILASADSNKSFSKESSVLSSNTWYNLVITKSAGQIEKIYINGQDDTQSTTSFLGFFGGRNNTYIGATYQGTAYANELNGSISEVAIFDYALSEAQISTLYGSSSLGAGNPLALKPAPVAFYPLGDNSSGNPLTQPNEAVEDASVFDFDRSNEDEILIDENNNKLFQGVSAFTVSAWAKVKSQPGYDQGVVGNDGSTRGFYMSMRNSSEVKFFVSTTGSSNDQFTYTNPTSTLNNWIHFVVIWDGSNMDMYINGMYSKTQACVNATGTFTAAVGTVIGALGQGVSSNYNFDGEINNVQIWYQRLSHGTASVGDTAGGDIATLYNSGVPLLTGTQPQASNLKAWYKLDQSANWEADSSGAWQIPDAVSAYPQSFNFVDDKIEIQNIGNLFSGITNFSFSGWFNLTSFGSQQVFNILEGNNSRFGINTFNNQLRFNIHSGVAYIANLQNITSVNQWFHYAGVFNGSGASDTDRLKLYINGQPQTVTYHASTPNSFPTLPSTADISIGGALSPFNGMTGKSSNIQLWTSSLTPSQIETLYNNGVPLTTAIASDNLKLWAKLDNTATFSTNWSIPDASGNGNTGTSSGMTEQNLVNNNVSVLNGESSGMTSANLVLTDLTRNLPYDSYSFNFDYASLVHINIGNISALNAVTNFSISVWVNPDNITGSNKEIFTVANNTSQAIVINHHINQLVYGVGPTNQFNKFNSALTAGVWAHLCFVFDGSQSSAADKFKLYKNGVYVTPSSATQSATVTPTFTGDAFIGAWALDQTNFTFDGKMSNFSIFNESLTSTEVMKLYSNGMPQDLSSFTPAPIAWWTLGSNSFFNGTNFICKDLIGSNDGTSVNAGVDALQGNTPRSEANGTGTNMDIPTNLEGTTKYSSNNSWSINMSESARVADTP